MNILIFLIFNFSIFFNFSIILNFNKFLNWHLPVILIIASCISTHCISYEILSRGILEQSWIHPSMTNHE